MVEKEGDGPVEPLIGLHVILLHAAAVAVREAHFHLGRVCAALGGFAKPLGGFGKVLGNTGSLHVSAGQFELRFGIAALSPGFQIRQIGFCRLRRN